MIIFRAPKLDHAGVLFSITYGIYICAYRSTHLIVFAVCACNAIGAELSNIKEVCGILGSVRELDERAAQEECTVAGAAQALARIACRLFDLADILGGVTIVSLYPTLYL